MFNSVAQKGGREREAAVSQETLRSKAKEIRILGVPEPLIDLVARIHTFGEGDGIDPDPTIFAVRPFSPDSEAVVLAEDAVDGVSPTRPAYAYLLEVDLALEVLEVWSAWRDGAMPSGSEAAGAVIHYAIHDAFAPIGSKFE